MDQQIQEQFNSIERQRQDVVSTVAGLTDEQAMWKPAASSWSVAQIVEHLVLSDETLGAAKAPNDVEKASLPFRLAPPQIVYKLIIRAMTNGQTLPLPSRKIDPTGKVTLPELAIRWEHCRLKLMSDLESMGPEEVRFSHPAIGPITPVQMLTLTDVHVSYHTRQLTALRSSNDFPPNRR